MTAAQWPLLAAALLFMSSGLRCSSPPPACPESCTCERAPLLNCSSSGLSSVPRHIQDSVTELDLSHNLFDSVTVHQPHRNLRNVLLGDNNITHLSLCIERNLGSKSVRGRHLHSLRPWTGRGCVSWAPTLQLLSVERNQLVQLPEGLEGSESLQVLQLSYNRISTLRPGDFSHLRQLKALHLQHNLITSLHPQIFQELVQLKFIDLSFNMLTSLHPLMYISLRSIGADVRLDGNRWQCDCSMRSVRRRMAYDSSRGLRAWSMVCAFPSTLSGKDLLQLEEDDLNCFGTENKPELHRDVTVYSGSEILMSCSTQDSLWWTPNGQASVSQPHPGMLISDVRERDTGLYVCMSEEHEVVSVFNLQISRVVGVRRKTRSLPRASRQVIPQGTPNRIGQERNQRAKQNDLVLAVCLSVLITFLIAFILGVLARPCIDVLWKKATNKKSPTATNSVSSVEQGQFKNEAYLDDEEPEEIVTHRERRVTFSTVDFGEYNNVQYYDTIISGEQESINSDAVTECETAKAEGNKHTAGDSGSENSLRQSSPEDNQRDGRELSGITDEGRTHIHDPVELEDRRSLSLCSDSSQSDRVLKGNQQTQEDHATPKSPQLAEDSVQQSADFSTSRKAEVPQISIEGRGEIPGFSSEPFADWSPHTNNINPTDSDLWQENEEQFEFSDSVRSTSARSSSMFGSFNDSKRIVVPTSDKQSRGDMSSSSSYVSEDEPTQYTVNSGQEEEEDTERNHNISGVTNTCLEQDASFEQQIHDVDPIRPPVGSNQGGYRHDTQKPEERPEHPLSSHSSDSDSERNTREKVKPTRRTKWRGLSLGVTSFGKDTRAPSPSTAYLSSSSSESEAETTDFKVKHNKERVNQIKKHLDINAPSPSPDSSAGSDSEDERAAFAVKQRPAMVDIAELEKSQTVSHDPDARWPDLDLEHIPHVKRRLDIKAPSPESSSNSDSEDETTNQVKKQDQGEKTIPFKASPTLSHEPNARWPDLDLEHIPSIKRRLDIKAPSPDSDSSAYSNSEDERADCTVKQRPAKVDTAEMQKSQTVSHDPDARWPALDLEHIPHVKRRLAIKASSPDSDSSAGSEGKDERADCALKQRPVKVDTTELQKSQTVSHDPDARWPALDLEHIPRVKRHLDIKAPSPDSSSGSDSEDETTNQIKKQDQGETHIASIPIKVSQTVSHDPDARWPALDLEHIPHVKRRLDIKAPSPDSDSSAGSENEDERADYTVKQRPAKVDIAELQKSQTVSHDPDARWPALDLEHIPHVKRRLDIKAPSPESSSNSDSEDETTNQIKKQDQGEKTIPFKASPTLSHDPNARWPDLDLEHIPSIKRRLDIKAPSPDLSSGSDGEDETTNQIKKQDQGEIHIASIPIKVSQSHDPDARWPALDLEHIPHVKRRLDIKAPSLDSDSSAGSENEDERVDYTVKQRPAKVDIAELQKSQTVSHDPDARWPALDLEHIPHVKRRLDIKAPSPESSSNSDSEDETTNQIKKQDQGEITIPFKASPTLSHDPNARWPDLDLEHIPSIKRRLDIKAPSPDSSSGSDGEATNQIRKQDQGEIHMASIPIKVSQSHDPDARWPALDLEHIPHVKRRLDIKAPSPSPDSSSSRDSEDETKNHIKEQGAIHMASIPIKVVQTASHDPQTQWPTLDLGDVTRIKRRLDIKAPSPDSDSSSSSDNEGEMTHYKEGPRKVDIAQIKKNVKGEVHISNPPLQKSQTVIHDAETLWPSGNLGNIPRIKRHLDIKAPSSPPDSLSHGSTNHTAEGKTGEANKISHHYSSSSSDEQEDLSNPSITAERDPDSKWSKLGLSSVPHFKRRLDIRTHLPSTESSSSSDVSDSGTKDLPVKVERDRTDVGNANYQPGTQLPDLSKGVPTVKRRLNIKASPQPAGACSSNTDNEGLSSHTVNSGISSINRHLDLKASSAQPDLVLSGVSVGSRHSGSDSSRSEDEDRDHNAKGGMGVSATSKAPEKEFIRSLKIPEISFSHKPKTDHHIKLERYTVLTDDLGVKPTNDNINTTPVINPELQSRWATMNLGISRSRKRIPHVKKALDIRAPLQRQSSSSSNNEDEMIDHGVPDLSLGIPRIKRRLNIKGPSPEPSNSPSSCSESENEVRGYTVKQSMHASNMSGMTDNDSQITYRRLIIKDSLPVNNKSQTTDHAEMATVAQEGQSHSAPRTVPSLSFGEKIKKRIKQSRHTADVDLPPEIKWTGVGRNMPDFSISTPQRRLDVDLSSSQDAPSAELELAPCDSSNYSSSDDKISQDKGKADVTSMYKYSSFSGSTVSPAHSRALDKFDNSSGHTNEILRFTSEDRRERKGLTALKAMSSERRKWDTADAALEEDAGAFFDDHGRQGDTSRFEDIKFLPQQPLTQPSSTSVYQRRTIDLLYGIRHYRRHDVGDIEPPQEAPPPIPTPPPDDAVGQL